MTLTYDLRIGKYRLGWKDPYWAILLQASSTLTYALITAPRSPQLNFNSNSLKFTQILSKAPALRRDEQLKKSYEFFKLKFEFFSDVLSRRQSNQNTVKIGGDETRSGYLRYVSVISTHFT